MQCVDHALVKLFIVPRWNLILILPIRDIYKYYSYIFNSLLVVCLLLANLSLCLWIPQSSPKAAGCPLNLILVALIPLGTISFDGRGQFKLSYDFGPEFY